jgi:hypothetical protein
MTIALTLNIQMSVSSILNIEGSLFAVDVNVQRQLPINLIR